MIILLFLFFIDCDFFVHGLIFVKVIICDRFGDVDQIEEIFLVDFVSYDCFHVYFFLDFGFGALENCQYFIHHRYKGILWDIFYYTVYSA